MAFILKRALGIPHVPSTFSDNSSIISTWYPNKKKQALHQIPFKVHLMQYV